MLDVGGKIGHYAPDHAMAMGQMVANTSNYLNSLRPTEIKLSPLDVPFKPPFQQERFESALDIADQPLITLQKLKDGMLTSENMTDLKAMFPDLYSNIATQLTESLTDHLSKGEDIDYQTSLGLSMFLGKPLDSTMTPASIQSAQMAQNRTAANEQAKQMASQKAPKGKSLKSLDKMSEGYATASQTREAQKQSEKV